MSSDTSVKEEFLANADLAAESVMLAAGKSGKPLDGKLYFLIEEGYACRTFQQGTSFQNQRLTPQTFPNGLDTFVIDTLAQKDCIGLVPLSEDFLLRLRSEYGLRPKLIGVPLQEASMVFELYHRDPNR